MSVSHAAVTAPPSTSRLLFFVGESRLALECRSIVEVVPRIPLQRAVSGPAALAGYFDYRGTLIPVVDLHALLVDQACPADRAARIAVVNLHLNRRQRLVGLLAEGFTRLISGDTPVQESMQVPDRPYLSGWVHDGVDNVQRVVAESLLGEAWLKMLLAQAPLEEDVSSGNQSTTC